MWPLHRYAWPIRMQNIPVRLTERVSDRLSVCSGGQRPGFTRVGHPDSEVSVTAKGTPQSRSVCPRVHRYTHCTVYISLNNCIPSLNSYFVSLNHHITNIKVLFVIPVSLLFITKLLCMFLTSPAVILRPPFVVPEPAFIIPESSHLNLNSPFVNIKVHFVIPKQPVNLNSSL